MIYRYYYYRIIQSKTLFYAHSIAIYYHCIIFIGPEVIVFKGLKDKNRPKIQNDDKTKTQTIISPQTQKKCKAAKRNQQDSRKSLFLFSSKARHNITMAQNSKTTRSLGKTKPAHLIGGPQAKRTRPPSLV